MPTNIVPLYYYRFFSCLSDPASCGPPSCSPQKCFYSPTHLFATYEHDVSIYDLWNVPNFPCVPFVSRLVDARAEDAIDSGGDRVTGLS